MKIVQPILLICLSLVTHHSISQSNGSFSSGGGIATTSADTTIFSDSIPAQVKARMETFLENRGIKREFKLSNIQNKKYFTMIPLKIEKGTILIWADFHFDKDGNWTKVVTKISNPKDDFTPTLGNDMSTNVLKCLVGFEREFGSEYEDIIFIYELKNGSYVEVYHPTKTDGSKIKFDLEGNLIAD